MIGMGGCCGCALQYGGIIFVHLHEVVMECSEQ